MLRTLRLIPKFLTSQTGQQLQHKYCTISQEDNQAMKSGQLMERVEYFCSKIMQKIRQGDYFQNSLFKKNALFKEKTRGHDLGFNILVDLHLNIQ